MLERDYEYSLEFAARNAEPGERCYLCFGGIDTFAEFRFNGALLGKTENMFLRYEYDVTDLLKKKNLLCVRMCSTLKRMQEIDAEKYFACFNKERIFLRKAQCHFGWDWAPIFRVTESGRMCRSATVPNKGSGKCVTVRTARGTSPSSPS